MRVRGKGEVSGGLVARNTGWNLAGQLVPLGFAVVALPAVVRGLGVERFGVLAVAWMVLGYVSELGFGRAATKFVAAFLVRGEVEGAGAAGWTAVVFQAVLGVVAGVVLAVAAPVLAGTVLRVPAGLVGEAQASLWLIAAGLPLILVAAALRGVLEAAQRFDLVNGVRIPASSANYVLPLVGVVAGWGLPGIVALLVAGRVAVLVAYWVLAARVVPGLGAGPRLLPAGGLRRELLGFGGWVMVSTVVSPVLVYLDRFLLGVLVGMAAVAYYTAPYELVVRLLVVPGSVAAALFPAVSALAAGGGGGGAALEVLVRRCVKYVLVLVGVPVLVLVVAGGELLEVWLGAEFARESGLALRILAVGVLVNGLALVPFTLLQGLGRADLTGRFHLLELPVQLVLAWVLIRAWGVPGAALAWSLRVTLDAVLLFGAAVGRTRAVACAGVCGPAAGEVR